MSRAALHYFCRIVEFRIKIKVPRVHNILLHYLYIIIRVYTLYIYVCLQFTACR